MSLRTIYVIKEQYYVSPGDTGGNSTVFTEIDPGVLESSPLSYTINDNFGFVIPASRPTFDVPPNSDWDPDDCFVDPTSSRVFFSSDDQLRFSLVYSFFGVTLPGNVLTTTTPNKLYNEDWWENSWTLEDPFGVNINTNYEYFLGNLLNYIDNNFPKEMDELTLVVWMNQLDGSVHIPFLFEGGEPLSYTRKFEVYND